MTAYIVLRRDEHDSKVWHDYGRIEATSGKTAVEQVADGPGEYRPIKAWDFVQVYDVKARKLYVEKRGRR